MLFSSYALILNEGVSIFSRTPLARSVSSSTCLKKRCNQYHVFWEVKGSVLRLCPLNGISSVMRERESVCVCVCVFVCVHVSFYCQLSTHAGPSTGPMQTIIDNKTHGKPGLSDRLLRTLGWLGGFYSRKAVSIECYMKPASLILIIPRFLLVVLSCCMNNVLTRWTTRHSSEVKIHFHRIYA